MRRSGKPSSMPVKPAEAMAESLEGRGSVGAPMETVAKEMGMEVRVEESSGMVGVVMDGDLWKMREGRREFERCCTSMTSFGGCPACVTFRNLKHRHSGT